MVIMSVKCFKFSQIKNQITIESDDHEDRKQKNILCYKINVTKIQATIKLLGVVQITSSKLLSCKLKIL